MSAALPVSITVRSASRLLCIEWDDSAVSELPHARLRARCRCAACTHAARRGDTPGYGVDVTLTAVNAVADGGLNLVFSDGHGRGIYPWAYLREIGAA